MDSSVVDCFECKRKFNSRAESKSFSSSKVFDKNGLKLNVDLNVFHVHRACSRLRIFQDQY